MTTSTKRILWIDIAKIIGLFLVILAHLYTSEGTGIENSVRTYIYGFHMPFFFLISGLLYKDKDQSPKDICIHNLKTLLLPFIIFNILAIIIWGIVHGSIGNEFINTFKKKEFPCGASWFVFCLFEIKLCYDLMKYYNLTWYSIVIIFAIAILPFHMNVLHFQSFLLGYTFFFVGAHMSKYTKKLSLNTRQCFITSLLVAPLLFITSYFLTQLNGKVSLASGIIHNPILFYINAVIGSLGIILLSISIQQIIHSRNRIISVINSLAQASLTVVLTHMYFVVLFRDLRTHIKISEPYLFIVYSLCSIAIYFICKLVYIITYKYCPQIYGKHI